MFLLEVAIHFCVQVVLCCVYGGALLKRRDEGDIYITYDIACTLHKNLEVCYTSVISIIKPSVHQVQTLVLSNLGFGFGHILCSYRWATREIEPFFVIQ